MARIYVASSWRNELQPGVVKVLRRLGHAVYDFREPDARRTGSDARFGGAAESLVSGADSGFRWTDVGLQSKTPGVEEYRAALQHPASARGYLSDFRAMEWADTCVLVLPCGRSAHLEAGWFAGRGKRLLILTRDGEEPELMALMASHICGTVDELLAALREGATHG